MAAWELVADDENTPNTDAARSQIIAWVAENCDYHPFASGISERRWPKLRWVLQHSKRGMRHLEHFPRKFPPQHFPGRPLARSLASPTTRPDGHGNGRCTTPCNL